MLKTINQLNLELAELARAHGQINSYAWKDFLRAFKEQELNYPLMCAYYPSGALLDNQTDIQLTIVIADKVYKDWSNLNDVESDTLGICRALFNVINRSNRWMRIGRVLSCNVTKFVERGGDEVAGHTMSIQFRMRDTNTLCDLPVFDYDFDTPLQTRDCLPVQIFENGILIATVPSGSAYNFVNPPCADATVENSDQSYTDTVASGGTLVLPDINVTDSDGSTYTQPSVTDVVCTPNDVDVYINNVLVADGATDDVLLGLFDQEGNELVFTQEENDLTVNIPVCADATVNINNIEVGTAPSGGTLDLNLIDQNSGEVPFTQSGNDIIVTLPESARNTSQISKTGQTISYATGDDGDEQRGRDFFKLDEPNHFGHIWRFTGINGAYFDMDTLQFKNADGSVIGGVLPRSTAFPNRLLVDHATRQPNGNLNMYYLGDTWSGEANLDFTTAQTFASGLTVAGYSGWKVCNIRELIDSFFWWDSRMFPPLQDGVQNSGTIVIVSSTTTTYSSSTLEGIRIDTAKMMFTWSKTSTGGNITRIFVRVTNISEL